MNSQNERRAVPVGAGYPTPLIEPLPERVRGVSAPVIDLGDRSGTWRFLFDSVEGVPAPWAAKEDFDPACMPASGWKPVEVPCELVMQGFDIDNNTEYYYQRELAIPADFAGKRIILRFDGVYSDARCWIDGRFVCRHTGGFTSWDADITDYVRAGGTATLTVGVADLEGSAVGNYNPDGKVQGNPAWASFYAHHNIGGILRDVMLVALPRTFLAQLHVDTRFDREFRDAELRVFARLMGETAGAEVSVRLVGEEREQPLEARAACTPDGTVRFCLPVSAPRQWDAEHPNLYTLEVSVERAGASEELVCERVGFREIHYGGRDGTDTNKLYVNGREVKLRGTCRHDVSPRGGRSTTAQEDWDEISAYRDANINHIRTSHYPPSRHLLRACDELGMYVEEENSACFKGANGVDIYAAPEEFLSPFTEMVERDRNHPCVIIWSLGNESGFERTAGFRMEYDYIKANDPSRPVIFSYPHTVETLPLPYDVCSRHYEDVNGVLGSPSMPVLHDEFAHIPCYDLDELRRNPNVHNYWGQSLRRGWERLFVTDGALGADLWGGIDDVFPLPEGMEGRWQRHSQGAWSGYGEWGCVLDCWRRLKPEAYLTRKAYSPVRLDERAAVSYGGKLIVPVKNWFDHTSFAELRLMCAVDGGSPCEVALPAIEPHAEGLLAIDVPEGAQSVALSFMRGAREIDAFCIRLKGAARAKSAACDCPPAISQTRDEICVDCRSARFVFSRRSSQLVRAEFGGEVLLTGGPHLHVTGRELGAWNTYRAPVASLVDGQAVVVLHGSYGGSPRVQFVFHINGDGSFTVEYQLAEGSWRSAELAEVGLAFDMPGDVESVSWEREAPYSVYPEGHIGRGMGTARRVCAPALEAGYGAKPGWEWQDDMFNAFEFAPDDPAGGLATNDFRTMREHIRSYEVSLAAGRGRVCVKANADVAARVEMAPKGARLIVDMLWRYPHLGWGNDMGRELSLLFGGALGAARIELGAGK